MVDLDYDERLLVCQECNADFIYTIEEQMENEREGSEPPAKCHRCRTGGTKTPAQASRPQARPRGAGGRDGGGRGPGRGRGRDPFREEYRSPSFRDQPTDNIYRSPAFSDSDPSHHRDRANSPGGGGGGGRSPAGAGRQAQNRPRYQITCSKCGRSDTIPFKPSPSRPVFCHECYEAQRLEERKKS